MIRYTTGKEIDIRYPNHFVGKSRMLDHATRDRVFVVIEEAQDVACEESLKRLFCGCLNELIPHQMAVCGIGMQGKRGIGSRINIGFSERHLHGKILAGVIAPNQAKKIGVDHPAIQIINDQTHVKSQSRCRSEEENHQGIRNMLISRMPDIGGASSNYICLAQCPGSITEEHRYLMELITPHLHMALIRVLNTKSIGWQRMPNLTAREDEVLQAMCEGHTNKEIAALLSISGHTVRNHVSRICEKLGVANRTMAVVKANGLRE